jgi:hypothetical protein
MYKIIFCNESVVLNPKINISRLLCHKIFTDFKDVSYFQENMHNFLYKD